ncbi:hypothetical protein ES702_04981 [subsurface metagenome]
MMSAPTSRAVLSKIGENRGNIPEKEYLFMKPMTSYAGKRVITVTLKRGGLFPKIGEMARSKYTVNNGRNTEGCGVVRRRGGSSKLEEKYKKRPEFLRALEKEFLRAYKRGVSESIKGGFTAK